MGFDQPDWNFEGNADPNKSSVASNWDNADLQI